MRPACGAKVHGVHKALLASNASVEMISVLGTGVQTPVLVQLVQIWTERPEEKFSTDSEEGAGLR